MFGRTNPGAGGETETWDGSSWTETGDLNSTGGNAAGFGTTTAAIAAGRDPGGAPPYNNKAICESFDGSSWTEVNNMNTAREGSAGFGIQTNGIGTGGYVQPATAGTASTEEWDGTSWTEAANNPVSRLYHTAAGGTGSLGLSINGNNPAPAGCEEWTKGQNVKVITD